MSFAPYEPPAQPRDARPAVILWYRAYAWLMALLSLAGGLFAMLVAERVFAAVVALGLVVLFAIAALVPFRPWGWTMALAAISLGLFGVTMPIAIPLLLFWWRPTVKAAFARL